MSGFYTKPECGSVQSVHDPETIHDIIADILAQNQGLPEDAYALSPLVCDMLHLADRLVAAYKRELGNVQKMREALDGVYNILKNIRPFSPRLDDVSLMLEFNSKVCHARNIIDAALVSPPRNCDVGTADEQVSRHCKMCTIISRNGTRSCDYSKCNKCFAKWGQMLYTKPEDASTGQEEGK